MFTMFNQNHIYTTALELLCYIPHPQYSTSEKYSLWTILCKFRASETWSKLPRTQNLDLLTSEPNKFKKALSLTYLAKYSNNTKSHLLFIIYCNFLCIFMSSVSLSIVTGYHFYCYVYYFNYYTLKLFLLLVLLIAFRDALQFY